MSPGHSPLLWATSSPAKRRPGPQPQTSTGALHENELAGLRIYRVRWNGNYLVEAAFSDGTPEARLKDAVALLGESGIPVHPDDLADYKRATDEGSGLPDWLRRFFGGRQYADGGVAEAC